mgnify:CR=1 FL=1
MGALSYYFWDIPGILKSIQEGICDITAADTFEDCIGPIKRIKQHIIGPSIL